jgi:DNA-binding CsgD family transcriptional regulator
MRRTLAAKPQPATAECGPDAQAGIVRRLIELTRPAVRRDAADATGVVVLDVRVDEYRCVIIRQPTLVPGRADETVQLSPREQEIARMVAKGFPNKMIARVLEISTWTVGTYLRRIFAKLAVSSRAAMVAKLMKGDPFQPDSRNPADLKRCAAIDPVSGRRSTG